MYKLGVRLFDHSYPIYIEKGLFDEIGSYIKDVAKTKKISIVTDSNVDRLYGEKLVDILQKEGFNIKKIVVEPGEKSKSFATFERVLNEMLDFSMTRSDLIIAFGGGVVGDLTGFVASSLLRGVDFVQIPTTLLSQVDSSVGGKVAINTNYGKNLVGAFYQPVGVYIDPNLLKTLDQRYLADGMAEVIKYGCIKDKNLFYDLLSYSEKEFDKNIEKIIYTCCNIKRIVVEKDEKDTGDRMLLNFGHTIGHAIEKYFNYESFTHGEAVALGMYMITKTAETLGDTSMGTSEVIKEILRKYSLPVLIDLKDRDKVLNAIGLDKKNIGKSLNIILLKEVGQSYIKKIQLEEIEKYIEFN
ncbi:3-dehydroquinate synthase [Clostridium cylindrosporum]|uniref:3-dehydroquinate synthase n=1 Tax=Clostridium cylindrosporum DSM 605 TaxID=1121307 RepID=A0A0J8G4X8_CLOCY|nr:3-dehydroquinate synthase [Clostridium cylindrosporum]KMT22726.1 3-dehydroquinate synthase AroB [Clostridium cylindrosporum DSM 605]